MPKVCEESGPLAPIAPPRIPVPVDGIQVNFCKNPCCLNFGKPASAEAQKVGRAQKAAGAVLDNYIVVGSTSKDGQPIPLLKCKRCGEHPTIKSNLAIAQEVGRFWPANNLRNAAPSCQNPSCVNYRKPIKTAAAEYLRHGKTPSGSPRYKCKRCSKVLTDRSAPQPASKQSIHKHKNISVFKLLVAKVPFRRICELESFSMPTLYQKMGFLYKQCLAFAANREQELPRLKFERLNIAVDRQDYVINWNTANDKRNITLHCVASADNTSGYIFGAHLDYDPAMDRLQVEDDARAVSDAALRAPFRKYARLWLESEPLPRPRVSGVPVAGSPSILDQVRDTYATAQARPDIEIPIEEDVVRRLPRKGMQVHSEYPIYGHFELLKRLLSGCEKIVFYLDQESGIRAACHAAFWKQILEKRCDAFFVKIDKELTVNEKRQLKAQCDKELSDFLDKNPALVEARVDDVRLFYLAGMIKDTVPAGRWQDEWLVYPFPNMSEPKKAVCWLTDLRDHAYDDYELAELYLRASLHGIDRFFMQMRRLTSLLERPIATSSSARRLWYAYAPYSPLVVAQLVEIFRVYYNYIKVGNDKKTPAMRLGLAKGKVSFEDIIYFNG
jgi:transposase-like protein